MQEVFVKLYTSPLPLSIKNLRAYIFQMARNLAINSTKQARHVLLDEISDNLYRPLDDTSLRMDIDDALKTLLAQECQIVTMHIIGALKFREISDIMQIPLGTALWKYRQAKDKLQALLSGGM